MAAPSHGAMRSPHWIATFLLVAGCAAPRPADTFPVAHPVNEDEIICVMRLEHTQAEEIGPRISDILNPKANAGTAPGPDVVRIAVAPGQNGLVLQGLPARIQEARELIARLDVPLDPATRR